MIDPKDYAAYKEYRWGKLRDDAKKLRPVEAKYAWAWLKADIVRRARDAIDPISWSRDPHSSGSTIEYRGATFTVSPYLDTDYNPLEDEIKYVRQNGFDEPPTGNSKIFTYGGRYGERFSLVYDENAMYEEARKTMSKGVARRYAVLQRERMVEYVRNVYRGDISFTSFTIKCEQDEHFVEWVGPISSDEDISCLVNEVEDVLRSALPRIQKLKDRS